LTACLSPIPALILYQLLHLFSSFFFCSYLIHMCMFCDSMLCLLQPQDYVVQGWAKAVGRHGVDGWVTLADSKLPRAHLMSESSDGHVLHTLPALTLPKGPKWLGGRRPSVSKVKLLIRSPATQYGSSVWQMQVWGTCGGSNDFAAR
jgi:hypothetical protein